MLRSLIILEQIGYNEYVTIKREIEERTGKKPKIREEDQNIAYAKITQPLILAQKGDIPPLFKTIIEDFYHTEGAQKAYTQYPSLGIGRTLRIRKPKNPEELENLEK
jgi:hypothetical protein